MPMDNYLIKLTRNQIVSTIFRLIWNTTDVRLVPNQSENGKCNLIPVWFNKISLCVVKSNIEISSFKPLVRYCPDVRGVARYKGP